MRQTAIGIVIGIVIVTAGARVGDRFVAGVRAEVRDGQVAPARPTPPIGESPAFPTPPPSALPPPPIPPPPSVEVLAIAIKGADARIDALDKRIAALEARKR